MSKKSEVLRARQLVLIDPDKSLKAMGSAEIRGSLLVYKDLIVKGKIVGEHDGPCAGCTRTVASNGLATPGSGIPMEQHPTARTAFHATVTSEQYEFVPIKTTPGTDVREIDIPFSKREWVDSWAHQGKLLSRVGFMTTLSETIKRKPRYKERMEAIVSEFSGEDQLDSDQLEGELYYPGGLFEHIWGNAYDQTIVVMERVRKHHQMGPGFYTECIKGDSVTISVLLNISGQRVKTRVTIRVD